MMEAWTSPVLPKMLDPNRTDDNPLGRVITQDEESWIGALISIGASAGPFIAAFAADHIGRKWTLLALGVPLAASFIMLVFSNTIGMIYTARTLSGISVGGVFAVLPTYIAEVSEVKIRGMMSTTMNNFEVSGMLLAYVIGPYVSIKLFNILCALVPLLFLLCFLPMPESPYYLIAKDRKGSAKECLKKLRIGSTDSKVEKELEEIKECVDQYLGSKYTDIISSKSNLKALLISLGLITAQQLSGVNIVTFYTQLIFEATGSSIPAEISSIIIGAVQVIAAFITPLVVDKLGRRVLLMISAIGALISEAPLGLYFHLKNNDVDVENIYWLPVVCLIVYMIVFNFGFGPLPWTIMSELFPDNMKAVATSLTSFLCWILSFIITKYFESVSGYIGIGGSFWIFSGFNLLAAFFIYFFVPETKGKTFQEIQNDLQR
nr:facilitated trehalose transporter Tret1-like [Onthophagus taurus]